MAVAKQNIGFLGMGKMGKTIALALLDSKNYPHLIGYDPALKEVPPPLAKVHFVKSAEELEAKSDLLLLCVKPQDLSQAVQGLKGGKRYISIMAGISIGKLCSALGIERVCAARVMPNLTAAVGCSPSAVYCEDDSFSKETQSLFSWLGPAFSVEKEDDLHAITALGGSGPALAAAFVQACTDGAVAAGLTQKMAFSLALQTVRGTVELMEKKNIEPKVLCKQTASPGGTTQAALDTLEKSDFHGLVMAAVRAAAQRSRELA